MKITIMTKIIPINKLSIKKGQVSSDCTACGSSPKSPAAMEASRGSASTGHPGRSPAASARDRVPHRRHAKSSPNHPPQGDQRKLVSL